MLFSPYFWLLIAALMAGSWMGGCTHEKKVLDEYKAEVEADRKVRQDEVARINKERIDSLAGVAKAAAAKDASRDVAFAALHARNSALESRLAGVRVDSRLLNSLRDTVSTANGSDTRPATSPPDDASTTADATGASGAEVAGWFETVASYYAKCRDQVAALISAYDKVRAAH